MSSGLSSGKQRSALDRIGRLPGLAATVIGTLAILLPLSLTAPWRLLDARSFDYLSTVDDPLPMQRRHQIG